MRPPGTVRYQTTHGDVLWLTPAEKARRERARAMERQAAARSWHRPEDTGLVVGALLAALMAGIAVLTL